MAATRIREDYRALSGPEKAAVILLASFVSENATETWSALHIERTLGAYTGDPAFARDFFARHIRGREVVDYAALLAQAGVVLRQARPDRAWSGLRLGRDDATLSAGTTVGTPAYDAGLERGDVVRSLDGRTVQGAADVLAVEAAHRPGDVVTVVFEQHRTPLGDERYPGQARQCATVDDQSAVLGQPGGEPFDEPLDVVGGVAAVVFVQNQDVAARRCRLPEAGQQTA